MKKEELIKKLESLDVPDAPVENHRLKLRKALMAAAQELKKEPSLWERVKWQIDRFGVVLERPFVRFAFSTAVALLVFLSLFFGYRFAGDLTPTVLASNIALNSPQVPDMLDGTGDIRVLNVDINGETARVLCGRNIGSIVQVDIDLKTKKMLHAQRLAGLFMMELNEKTKEDAVAIALSDMRVNQLVAQGVTVKRVIPSLSSMFGVIQLNDDTLKVISATDKTVVQLEFNGRSWLVQVNMNEGRVERIIEPQSRIQRTILSAQKSS